MFFTLIWILAFFALAFFAALLLEKATMGEWRAARFFGGIMCIGVVGVFVAIARADYVSATVSMLVGFVMRSGYDFMLAEGRKLGLGQPRPESASSDWHEKFRDGSF